MGGCVGTLSLQEKVAVLAQTPLFALKENRLNLLAEYFVVKDFPTNSRIISEDEKGDDFFVIASGEVDVTASDVTKNDVFLCTKKRGDFFGDQALFQDNYHRNANVVTKCETQCLVLKRAAFEAFIAKAGPDAREAFAQIVGTGMVANLAKIPFLEGLSEWKLQLLASLFQYVPVTKGSPIFFQGDIGNEMYIISSGSVRVVAAGDNGVDTEIAKLYSGQYFGEIALMVNMPRTATVSAIEDCLLLSIQRDDFENFLQVVPDLTDKFDLVAKQRIAEIFKKYQIPFFASIPDEFFKQLADLCYCEQFDEGAVIFNEGDPGTTFYIVVFGRVSVHITKDGVDTVIKHMGPGRYFGEIALIRDTARTATVRADSRCVLLSLSQERFSGFFKQHPEAFADFEIKLARADVSLEAVLNHRLGLKYFTQHLQAEYSEENIRFYRQVRDYEQTYHSGYIGINRDRRKTSQTDRQPAPTGNTPRPVRIKTDELQAFQSTPVTELAGSHIRISTAEEMVEKAHSIVTNFISADAKEQINIQGEQRTKILNAVKAGKITPGLFDAAKEEILKLMARDSFKRFKQSQLFKDLLAEIDAYTTSDPAVLNRAAKASVATKPAGGLLKPVTSQTALLDDIHIGVLSSDVMAAAVAEDY